MSSPNRCLHRSFHSCRNGLIFRHCKPTVDSRRSLGSGKAGGRRCATGSLRRQSGANLRTITQRWFSSSQWDDDILDDDDDYDSDDGDGDDHFSLFPPTFDYNSWTKPKLKDLCRSRGLKVSGTKQVLVERLQLTDDEHNITESLEDIKDRPDIVPEQAELQEKADAVSNTESLKGIKDVPGIVPKQANLPAKSDYSVCFDKGNNHRLALYQELKTQGRESDALLSPKLFAVDESLELLELLPDELRRDSFLYDSNERTSLIEIVLDLQRRPYVWMKDQKRRFLNDFDSVVVSQTHLDCLVSKLSIGMDNRAGINGHLHRISVIRNREGE